MAKQVRQDVEFNERCKIRGQLTDVKVMVSPDGSVRLWDDVAGHYTLVHSLNASQQSRLRRVARILDFNPQIAR
jgi:hypothetical protein